MLNQFESDEITYNAGNAKPITVNPIPYTMMAAWIKAPLKEIHILIEDFMWQKSKDSQEGQTAQRAIADYLEGRAAQRTIGCTA